MEEELQSLVSDQQRFTAMSVLHLRIPVWEYRKKAITREHLLSELHEYVNQIGRLLAVPIRKA